MLPIDLIIVEFKRDLAVFSKSSKVINYCYNKSQTEQMLEELSKEMYRRYELFASKNVSKLSEYNKRYKKINRILVVIDEFASIGKDLQLEAQAIMEMSRASGIHFLNCTLRPSVKTIPGDMKALCECRIAMKLRTHKDSEVILDETGAENLIGKGRFLLLTNNLTECQAMEINNEIINSLISDTFIEKETYHKPQEEKKEVSGGWY